MKRRTERSQYGLAGRRGGRRTEPIGIRGPGLAMLAAAQLVYMAAAAVPAPAAAMEILEAADHAELTAEISATGVNRIALVRDRIARVIRGPGGYAVEHDPASGDLYLRPLEPEAAGTGTDGAAGVEAREPVTLFVGTEKGFTYRLALTPAARGSAQILIRNASAPGAPSAPGAADAGDAWVAALVALVRAVARREPLPGYAIEAGPAGTGATGAAIAATPEPFRIVETWRGARFRAHVVEVRRAVAGAADLAGTVTGLAGRIAAAWLAGPGTGPGGGRLAVVVSERAEDAP